MFVVTKANLSRFLIEAVAYSILTSKHVTKFTYFMNEFCRLIETSFLLVIHLSNWFNKTALKVYLNFKKKKSKFRYERAKVLLRCKC